MATMASIRRLVVLGLAVFTIPSSTTAIPATNPTEFGPSKAAARHNAFDIFNAIHSAMRQWGSSLNHNGMSLFVATIPPGVLLHHGSPNATPPTGPEWLAFELEHAELFAHAPLPPNQPPPGLIPPPSKDQNQDQHQDHQHPLTPHSQPQPKPKPPPAQTNGYLQTYLTTAPLPLLYIDGSSAGNTDMGTLDTQDLLLRLNRSASLWDEPGRARALCDLVTPWGLHGVLRMEAGFEVIKCDFLGPPGGGRMELVGVGERPDPYERGGVGGPGEGGGEARRGVMFGFIRGVGRRYGGIGSGRVKVDWGSMVSAWFFGGVDVGGGGGEAEKGRPRLVGVGDRELRGMRDRVEEVVKARAGGDERVVDWQGVVDLIVARYADRLKYMADGVESLVWMRGELNGLLNTHIDYSEEDEGYQAALGRCTRFYTRVAIPETQEDHLILAALETVTHNICSTLFTVRKLLIEDADADGRSITAVKKALRALMGKLRWTKWKECGGCNFDEVCFVPMWPFGDKGSYERPNCRNATSLDIGWWDPASQYWHPIPRMMPQPDERH